MEIVLHDGKTEVMVRAKDGNWEICTEKTWMDSKTGEMVTGWVAKKWYATVVSALECIGEMKLQNSDAKSLVELQAEVKRVRQEIIDCYEVRS